MKLVQILERHCFKGPSGWTSHYLIDGKEVPKEVFRKEDYRICLWKTETNTKNESHCTESEESCSRFNRKIKQYILLPWYKKPKLVRRK